MLWIHETQSTDHAKQHFDFFHHNINVKENAVFTARAEKGIAWLIDSSSDRNGKLANQIAKLVAS